jgi:hypothetical protein
MGWRRPPIPVWFCLSSLTWTLAVAASLALQKRAVPSPPGFRRLALAHAVLWVGGGLYLGGLLWAYCWCFRPTEALALASFGRYAGTYVTAWLMVLMTLPLSTPPAPGASRRFIVSACMAVLLALLALETTVSPVWPPLLSARREHCQATATEVRARTAPDSRLFHVSQGSDGFDHHLMRYELAPRLTQYWGWSLGTDPADAGATEPVPAEVWAKTLSQYDYVLLGRTDDRFIERYGTLFGEPAALFGQRLFFVNRRADGRLRLDPVR